MRAVVLAAALGAVAIVAGCAQEEAATPIACLDGPEPLLTALERAPEPVRLGGGAENGVGVGAGGAAEDGAGDGDGVAISDCLIAGQPGGQLAEAGSAMVAAAAALNERARSRPGGQANVALGYLLGAARAGAAETGGIHTDLIRRLDAAARFAPTTAEPPPAFDRALAAGERAGRRHG